MTEQSIIIKNRSVSIVWIGVIFLLLAVIIYQFKCGGNRSVDPKLAKLEKQIVDDSIREASALKLLGDSIKRITEQREFQEEIVKEKERNLGILEKQVDRLLAIHKTIAPPKPIDSGKYSVTHEWIANCADCFTALEMGRDSVKLLIKERRRLNDEWQMDWGIRNRELDTVKKYSALKDKRISELVDFAKKVSKPKVSVAIGIEAMYSPAVSNFGGWLQLKDKRGRIYGVDGGINTLQKTYFGMKAGFTLFGNR